MNQAVLNHPNSTELKENLAKLSSDQDNSFTDLYHWAKGENYDLFAMNTAIGIRNNATNKVKELKKKNVNTQKDIESLNAGKKTVNTLFTKDSAGLENKVS